MSSGHVLLIDSDKIRIRMEITFRLRSDHLKNKKLRTSHHMETNTDVRCYVSNKSQLNKTHSMNKNFYYQRRLAQRSMAIALQCDITTNIWLIESSAGESNAGSDGRLLHNKYDQKPSAKQSVLHFWKTTIIWYWPKWISQAAKEVAQWWNGV